MLAACCVSRPRVQSPLKNSGQWRGKVASTRKDTQVQRYVADVAARCGEISAGVVEMRSRVRLNLPARRDVSVPGTFLARNSCGTHQHCACVGLRGTDTHTLHDGGMVVRVLRIGWTARVHSVVLGVLLSVACDFLLRLFFGKVS